jgi:hypothetical protein
MPAAIAVFSKPSSEFPLGFAEQSLDDGTLFVAHVEL